MFTSLEIIIAIVAIILCAVFGGIFAAVTMCISFAIVMVAYDRIPNTIITFTTGILFAGLIFI